MFLSQMLNRWRPLGLGLALMILTGPLIIGTAVADEFVTGQQWSRWLGFSTYEVHRSQHFALPADAKLWMIGESVNVAVSDALLQMLGSRFARVYASDQAMELDAARLQAKHNQANFLFYYRVQQFDQGRWFHTQNDQFDDAKNAWQQWWCRLSPHNPVDKVQLTIWVWDVASERLLDTLTLRSRSSILSLWHQSPAAMLYSPLRKSVLSYSANIN
jgi:hypothetical protein